MKYLIPWNEVVITATRSSGAGGQHVNKTNSAIQLRFSIGDSLVLNEAQKELLKQKLSSRLVQGDQILVRAEEERDQKRNKEQAYTQLNTIIARALIVPKKRVGTKPTRGSIKRRLTAKTIRGEVKKNRSGKIDY
jgi:ribosome-associated protein